jgi:circadian clock protein KaiC
MVDGMIELGDQHYAWRAEREIAVRKFRGSGYLRGWHAMRIDDDGITVYPRLEAVAARRIGDKPAGRGRVTSGLAGLDEMLGGGLPESSATLVLGPTGSGKTAFGLHFLAAAPAGEAGLLVGFYESPAHLAERAAVHAPRLLPALAERQLEILWLPDAEDQVDRIAHALLENVERRGVRRLFLDGLLGLRTLTPYRERLPAFVRALGQELRARQVTALFTMEVPELIGSVVRAPATTLTPIADNLILLRYLEMGAEVRRLVSVLKVRDSGFDPRLRSFEVAPGAITIGAVFQGMEGLLSGFPRAVPDEESDPLPGPEEGPTRHQRPGR